MVTSSSARAALKGRVAAPAPVRSPAHGWMDLQAPPTSIRRYRLVRAFFVVVSRLYSSVRIEGLEHVPAGAAILCFTHQNWADPFYVVGISSRRRRVYFFGPMQAEMRRGARNRLMRWSGVVVPYRPGNRGLMAATARCESLLESGALIAIAGEGRIHSGEGVVLPLRSGPAYLSLRTGMPVVPVAINGTSWLGFRRLVRVRVGEPIGGADAKPSRPNAQAVADLTAQIQASLELLVADFPDRPLPGRVGRQLTELFNDWPEGARPPLVAPGTDVGAPGPIGDGRRRPGV
jgi:1-acyl-sn-glycerol-3-phosphate acyltransferase